MESIKLYTHSPALTGFRRICENDIANAVLSSKAAIMECENIQTDWKISLPKKLAISDIDLCALLGNAIDNAIEAVGETQDKRTRVWLGQYAGYSMSVWRISGGNGRKRAVCIGSVSSDSKRREG